MRYRRRVEDDGTIGIITTPRPLPPPRPAIRAQARDLLLTQAVDLDARALRQLGKRVLSIIAPEIADEYDAAWLAKQEALAHRDASLSLFDDGNGKCHGQFTVPSSVGERLKAHLLALATPARHHLSRTSQDAGV